MFNRTKRLTTIPYDKKEKGTDIIFLLDDSGSIEDNNFTVMVAAVEEAILNSVVPNPRFAVICFDSSVTLVCALTENREECIKLVKAYKRRRGATATDLGFKKANELFVRPGLHRRLFVLTDGSPTNPQAALFESDLLIKNKGVDIISIGVGNGIDQANLKATSSRIFLLEKFEELKELFRSKFSVAYRIPDYQISLIVSAIDFPIALGEDLTLKIGLKNSGRYEIPSGTEIQIVGNDYFECRPVFFQEPIPQGKSIESVVTIPAKGIKKANLLPNVLELEPSHCTVKLMCPDNGVVLSSDLFIREFHEFQYPLEQIKFFNILCFGIAGSGKSSFINGILTALSQEKVDPAAVGGSPDHVTTDITRFQVSQIAGLENVALNYFDIWGLEPETFKDDMLLDVLKGKLPEGYQMKERTTMTEDMKEASWNTYERRIHSILFFVPISICDNPAFVSIVSRNFKVCTVDYHMNPIIVVTRASVAGTNKEQEIIKQKIATKFSVPEKSIYLVDNYTNEKDKSMTIDKKTIDILCTSIQSCQNYHRFYKKSLLEEFNNPQLPNIHTTSLPIQKNETTRSNNNVCSNCSEPVEAAWDECPACEAKLEAKLACVCGTALKPNFKKCPNCKLAVTQVKNLNCWSCKEEIEMSWDECPACAAILKRPVLCCGVAIKPNYGKCPKCKKQFPPQ